MTRSPAPWPSACRPRSVCWFAPELLRPHRFDAAPLTAHLLKNIEDNMLHRAFSVFMFTPEGKLLLQQVSVLRLEKTARPVD